MASIAKRPDGQWRARYRDAAGKEHARHFARRVDAQRWLDEVTTAVVTGQYVDPGAGKETLRAYAERWRAIQSHGRGTEALYARVLRLHVYPVLGDKRLDAVRHSDVVAFLSGLARKGLAANTVRQVHAITRTIFRAAVADRLISVTPFERVELSKVQRSKGAIPDVDDMKALVKVAPERLSALVLLTAHTGMRSGELLGLHVEQVDFLRREIRVDRQLVYIPGQAPWIDHTKTPESVRTLPVPAYVVEALAEHLVRFPATAEGLVFQADKGGPILRTGLNGRWTHMVDKAGVRKGVTPHKVRKLYGSTLVARGVPFTTVQELLGHVPTGVTWVHYISKLPGWDKQVRETLESWWHGDVADSLRTADGS